MRPKGLQIGDGALWVSTAKQVLRIDQEQMKAVFDRQRETQAWILDPDWGQTASTIRADLAISGGGAGVGSYLGLVPSEHSSEQIWSKGGHRILRQRHDHLARPGTVSP
jgi:hypothetical protein